MRLIKKKLEQIPVPLRTWSVSGHFEVKAERVPYEGENIIVATIWFSQNEECSYRVYIAEKSYITQMFIGEHDWVNAKIFNYVTGKNYYWWSRRDEPYKVYTDEDTLKLLRERAKISGEEDDALWLINHIQTKIRADKIEQKEAAEQARWDAVLDTTPEVPEDFATFLNEKVFRKERYILYETTRSKLKRGTCTYCMNEVEIDSPHHNGYAICPSCESKVQLKNGKKQKMIVSPTYKCALVQLATSGKVVVRRFKASRDVRIESWQQFKVDNAEWELERVFVHKSREYDRYTWEFYKNKKHRFVPFNNNYGYGLYATKSAMYTHFENYKDVMLYLGCGMEYLPQEIFEHKLSFMALVRSINLPGITERLWKRGLKQLALDVTTDYVNYTHEKDLFWQHKVENDDIRILTEANVSMDELEGWAEFKKTGKRPTAEDIVRARAVKVTLKELAEICKYASVKKILHYLETQGRTRDCVISYKDYLSLLEELRMDMKNKFNLFPHNLIERHDALVEIKNEQANAKLKKQLDKSHSIIAKMEDALNERFGVENKTCFIRAPHSAYEIALEGQKLHHCVGGAGYRDKMKEGKSFILFVRKKSQPDIPWWTIEVGSQNNVIQYHGWGNKDKDKEDVEPIMRVFRKKIRKAEG